MSIPDRPDGALLRAARTAPAAAIETLAPPGGLLVLVPHPDDESFGCGEALAAAADAGRPIGIVLLTDGEGSHPRSTRYDRGRLAALRQDELRAALGHLAPGRTLPVHRVGLSDGASDPGAVAPACIDAILAFARSIDVRTIWTTWSGDPHCDHVTGAAIGRFVAERTGAGLWSFAVWGRFGDRDVPSGIRTFSAPRHNARKRSAIAAHRSQITTLVDDDPGGFVMPPAFVEHFARDPEIFIHER